MKCEPVLRHCQGVNRLLIIITISSIKIFLRMRYLKRTGSRCKVLIEQIEVT